MTTDAELLHRYVEERAEDAFAELVRRHLGLVYATALRRVGHDAHAAEDVAQKVFADLARKAASLTGRASLSGWLYVSTHHAAAEVVRSERRRKARETEAHTMQTLLHDSAPAPDWHRLRPVLDDALIALRDQEREAIALRFFEQRSFAEVGAALRLTEEAARKRVDRAVEKLRVVLAGRGITSPTAVVALALGGIASTVTPAGLATKVAGHALAHATAAGVSSGLVAAVGTSLAIGAALITGAFLVGDQHRTNRRLVAELAHVRVAPGALEALRLENRQLARSAADSTELRRLAAELPALRAAVAPQLSASAAKPAVRATLTVQSDGRLSWGSEPLSLADCVARLKALQETASNGEAKIGIRGLSEFSALAWAIDEARKAQIKHVVVESNATPDPKFRFSWF